MLSHAYFVAKFRFDTAENEPAKNLQNFRKMHFSKCMFRKCIFEKCVLLRPRVDLLRPPGVRRAPAESLTKIADAGQGPAVGDLEPEQRVPVSRSLADKHRADL